MCTFHVYFVISPFCYSVLENYQFSQKIFIYVLLIIFPFPFTWVFFRLSIKPTNSEMANWSTPQSKFSISVIILIFVTRYLFFPIIMNSLSIALIVRVFPVGIFYCYNSRPMRINAKCVPLSTLPQRAW